MLTIAFEITIYLLFASLIGGLIGYLICQISHKSKNNILLESETDDSLVKDTQNIDDIIKDNLTLLKGVGPKVEKTLNGLGIFNFEQIMEWEDDDINNLIKDIPFCNEEKMKEWRDEASILSK